MLLMGLIVFGFLVDQMPTLVAVPIMFLSTRLLHPTSSEDCTVILHTLTGLFTVFKMAAVGPLLSFALVAYENKEEELIFYDWIKCLVNLYRETAQNGISHTFGTNSASTPEGDWPTYIFALFSPMFSGLKDNLDKFLQVDSDNPFVPTVSVTYYRSNDIAPILDIDSGIPSVTADYAVYHERKTVNKRRWLTLLGLSLSTLLLSTATVGTPFACGLVLFYLWTKKSHVYVSDNNTYMTFPDGIYKLDWKILKTEIKLGIAVV